MAAGATYFPIATQTLGSAVADITFSSIPATYTDIIVSAQVRSPSYTIGVRFNGDTGSNYSFTYIRGTGSAATSSRSSNTTNMEFIVPIDTDPDRGAAIIQIQNYSNTTTNKTALFRNGWGTSELYASAQMWRNTAAINSITFRVAGSGNMPVGSTFTLYGIEYA
jgi:hypothetical protein